MQHALAMGGTSHVVHLNINILTYTTSGPTVITLSLIQSLLILSFQTTNQHNQDSYQISRDSPSKTRVKNLHGHGIPWRIRTSISMEFHGNFSIDFHGKYLHGGLGHFPWNSMENE